MALHASDLGVRRIYERGVLRLHHRMARLPAELAGIHVLYTFISGGAEQQDIQQGADTHQDRGAENERAFEIDHRILLGNFTGLGQLAPAQPHAQRHQHQAEQKNSGQNHDEYNSGVGMDGG